mmetsp:Transcript_25444/g.72961  ORF Transcript_25444/g.72961 Transcript_25444/m.72961 type:complete len:244 (+) Transcript_25444:1877-2608(+)
MQGLPKLVQCGCQAQADVVCLHRLVGRHDRDGHRLVYAPLCRSPLLLGDHCAEMEDSSGEVQGQEVQQRGRDATDLCVTCSPDCARVVGEAIQVVKLSAEPAPLQGVHDPPLRPTDGPLLLMLLEHQELARQHDEKASHGVALPEQSTATLDMDPIQGRVHPVQPPRQLAGHDVQDAETTRPRLCLQQLPHRVARQRREAAARGAAVGDGREPINEDGQLTNHAPNFYLVLLFALFPDGSPMW